MAILAFRLFGPLAAWGTGEAGEDLRPSARHPGRGAVFGLLAAALGLTRGQEDAHRALASGYDLAVAAHGRRRILRDFRTVQTVEPSVKQKKTGFISRKQALREGKVHTMTGKRDFVEEGMWRVFLSPRQGAAHAPEDLADALRKPRFELYLGRRSCPLALPPDPHVLSVTGLEEALDRFWLWDKAWFKADWRLKWLKQFNRDGFDLHWDEGFPGAPEPDGYRSVRDEPLSRLRWQYAPRREYFKAMERRRDTDAEEAA